MCPNFGFMLVEEEVMLMFVESPFKLKVGVDYYIDHGPFACVVKKQNNDLVLATLLGVQDIVQHLLNPYGSLEVQPNSNM
jgi:hypothetical protein